MTKWVGSVLICIAFFGTWCLFYSEESISMQTHAGIQSKFVQLLQNNIQQTRPESEGFEILSIYTERIDNNQIGTHFTFKFLSKTGEQHATEQISGTAILNRALSENPNIQTWVIKSIKTNGSKIDITDSLVITPETEE